MEILLKNRIRVKNYPDELLPIIVDKLQIINPKFQEAQASGRSVYNIEKNITNFSILPDQSLLLPRGVNKWLCNTAKTMGIRYVVDNQRKFFPYITIDSSKIIYRPYQYDGVIELITSATEGILVAPAGSGKTVMGLSLIALLGQPTLWLTHTGPLADQAIERANQFLPELGKIGMIGGGKWELGDILTIGMVQTLVRNPVKSAKMTNNFGTVILDECLPKGTTITMLDGSIKDISRVENGETTTFGKISNKFSRETDSLIELRGGWGNIKGTPTHRLPFVPYNKLVKDRHTGIFKQLTGKEVIIDRMFTIKKNDFLLIKESNCHTEKYVIGTDRARLLALIACDGHIEKHLNCIQIGVIKDIEWFTKEMYLATCFKERNIREFNCVRGDLILRDTSSEVIEYLNRYIPSGKKHELFVPSIMEYASLSDIKNYIQVAFDCEGGLNDNQITITMATPEYLIGIHHLLKKFGIISRIVPIKDKITDNGVICSGYARLAMSGYDAFLFWKKIGFSMKRKQNELFKIIKRCNKFVRRVKYNGILYRCMPVVEKKEILEKTTVYDFTTKEHFFIANGVLSSNCHHCPASTFLEVVGHFNSHFMYGLTATPYRRDKLEKLMFHALGESITTIPIEKVSKFGGIMLPTVIYREIRSPIVSHNNIQKILTENIVKNTKRNRLIVGDVLREAVNGKYCIVISDRRAHCEALYSLISVGWEKTGIATGKYSKKYVTEQVEAFYQKKITVLVTTFSLLGEGFDVPFLDRAFICMPFRAEAKAVQLIGRIQRTYEGKTDAIVYDYVDINVGVLKNQFHNKKSTCRYRTYDKLGLVIKPF